MAIGQMYIDGKWTDGGAQQTIAVINPATEEPVEDVCFGGREQAARAVDAAARALGDWRKRTAYERAACLMKIAALLRERADNIARVLTTEQGKPLGEAKGEIMGTAATFEWFAEEAKRVYGRIVPPHVPNKRMWVTKQPIGVCGAIAPWNFPVLLMSRKIAPALAAGCTIVCKPAEQTPLCCIEMFKCIEEAGVPAGVANLVIGEADPIGDEFMENPVVRKVSFTGSVRVGKILVEKSAKTLTKLSLELGGHAPVLIFPDYDVEAAAKASVIGKFRNNGQVCIAPTRFYAHVDIAEEFTEASVEAVRALKLGNGLDEGVEIGPMLEPRGMEKAARLISQAVGKGAKVLAGGGRSERFEKGYFFEPTVLTELNREMDMLTEEPFSPVMPLLSFDDVDKAIEEANNTQYGLAAYILTHDLTTGIRVAEGLEYGIIGLNDPVPSTPQLPFGGMKESGIGRENAIEGLDAYLETKSISVMLRE